MRVSHLGRISQPPDLSCNAPSSVFNNGSVLSDKDNIIPYIKVYRHIKKLLNCTGRNHFRYVKYWHFLAIAFKIVYLCMLIPTFIVMKKLFIETYGCQMNVADSEVVASIMQMAGYEPTDNETDADAIFLNTCSVRDNAENKIYHRLDQLNAMRTKRRRREERRARRGPSSAFSAVWPKGSRTTS